MTNEQVIYASKVLEDAVKWDFCDCGCPQQRSPHGPMDVALLKIAAFVRVELLVDYNYSLDSAQSPEMDKKCT